MQRFILVRICQVGDTATTDQRDEGVYPTRTELVGASNAAASKYRYMKFRSRSMFAVRMSCGRRKPENFSGTKAKVKTPS